MRPPSYTENEISFEILKKNFSIWGDKTLKDLRLEGSLI